MNSLTISPKDTIPFLFLTIIYLPVIFCSCAVAEKVESPFAVGYSIRTMPGLQVGESKTSVHSVLGYSRFKFKGGGGHTNFLQFGVQVRKSMKKELENGLWVGGEAAYVHITNKIGNSSTGSRASGFTLGAIAGYLFHMGKIPASIYLAPSFLHRGGFNTAGMTNSSSASGYYGNLGIDVHFMPLISKKGR